MPVKLNGETYYRSAEVCRIIGVSKTTLLRWVKKGIFEDARQLDRRGWRLFSQEELDSFKDEANRVVANQRGSAD